MVSSDPWARDNGPDGDATRRGLADIARELDRLEQRLQPPPRRPSRDTDIGALAGKVGALAEKLKQTEAQLAPRGGAATEARLDLLAQTIREIDQRTAALSAPRRAEPPGLERTLHDLRGRLESLKPSRPAALSADTSSDGGRERAERQLRAAIAEIAARQEAIDRVPEPRPAAPARIAPDPVIPAADLRGEIARLSDAIAGLSNRDRHDSDVLHRLDQTLNGELARISDALDGAAREATLASVEAGYNHLIERLDRLTRERTEANAPLMNLPGDMQRLSNRIDELARSLPERERLNDLAVGVAQLGRAVATREGGTEFAAMERRLEEIAGAVDGLYRVNRGEAPGIGALMDRMDQIAARLESATRHDSLDSLRDEVAALRDAVAGTGRPEADRLENQVRALVMRLDAMPQDNDGAIGQLEAQVARLADRLDQFAARPAASPKLEENLSRLESLVRSEALGAAREAARATVAEMSASNTGDNKVVHSLRDDLRRLQAAAENTDTRTQETLDTVQSALDKVVSRLAALETSPPVYDEPSAPASVSRPETNTQSWHSSSSPLADRVAATVASDRGVDRKADFIAAARRAAQAAAAESQALRNEAEPEEKSGPLARIGQALKRRRRPLMLAAAAVVLTIAVIEMFGLRTGSISVTAANAEKPAPVATAERAREARTARDILAQAAKTAGISAPAPDAARNDPALDRATEPPQAVAMAAPPAPSRPATTEASSPSVNVLTIPSSDPNAGAAPTPIPASTKAGTSGVTPMPDGAVGSVTLRMAAAAGDANALYEVGLRYAEGRDVPQNAKLAAEWFRRAAERGLPIAEFRVAAMYERGDGVAKDRKEARDWYAKAADQGNIRAMHNLAVMMSEGVDGAPDYGEATAWFIKAADHGVKDSQYNLGVIFARGLGRKQDLIQSFKWFALAAAQGDADATGRRDEVAKTLNPDQLAQARAAVQAWRSAPVTEASNIDPTPDPSWSAAPAEKRTALDRQGLVKKVQALLSERGYDPGPPDGQVGTKTKAAVKAFQSSVGVQANGEIDANLVAILSKKTS